MFLIGRKWPDQIWVLKGHCTCNLRISRRVKVQAKTVGVAQVRGGNNMDPRQWEVNGEKWMCLGAL